MRHLLFILLLFFVALGTGHSQTEKVNIDDYKPVVFGILKTKAEYDLDNSKLRFEVRNARFGAKGKMNPYFSYKAEIDLSDEGKIKALDTYIKFTPLAGLDFYLGQRKIPFSSDYIRSPAENIFANRSFLAKYINDGMRDIGFYVNYKLSGNFPIDITVGGVNGTGNNNPQWIDKPNLVGRIIAGHDDAFRLASNIYYGQATNKKYLAMFGEEVRYAAGHFFIESEYINSNWTDTLSIRKHDDGIYIHSYYNIKVNNSLVCLLTPTARLDFMGSSIFKGTTDAERLTLGLNTGFAPKQFTAEIRLNYEKYFKSSLPIETDKLTLECILVF
jgi:hypothetical protein